MLLKAVAGMHGAALLIGLAFVGVAILLGMMTGSWSAAAFRAGAGGTGRSCLHGHRRGYPLDSAAARGFASPRRFPPVAASTLISASIAGVIPQRY